MRNASWKPPITYPGYAPDVRLSRATADSAWLSKQLENGSSRRRAFEATERGKHAYPDSGHQIKLIQDSGLRIAETTLEGGTSPYHLRFSADK